MHVDCAFNEGGSQLVVPILMNDVVVNDEIEALGDMEALYVGS